MTKDMDGKDIFDMLRDRWAALLTGGAAADPADPDIGRFRRALAAEAAAYRSSMTVGGAGGSLWDGLDMRAASQHLTSACERIAVMAAAHAGAAGPELGGSRELLADLTRALDALYDEAYNEALSMQDNWWDWEIGAPLALVDALTLLHGQLSEERPARLLRAIDRFQSGKAYTGANLVWVCTIGIVCAVLRKDGARLAEASRRLAPVFSLTGSGDGFYRDGSFVQHERFAYTGGYGISLIGQLARLVYLLDGTPWDFRAEEKLAIADRVYESYGPLLYRGAMMDMSRGREIAREYSGDRDIGALLIQAVTVLASAASFPDVHGLRQHVKGWMLEASEGSGEGAPYAGRPAFFIAAAKALLSDEAIPARQQPPRCKLYAAMDRVVHRRPGFAFAVSMSSARIAGFESIIAENLRGWHTGDGMTYVYNGGATPYGGDYWPTVNPYRLPGTTVDTMPRAEGAGSGYLADEGWSGGVAIGHAGSAAIVHAGGPHGRAGRRSGEQRCEQYAVRYGGQPIAEHIEQYGVAGMSLRAWGSPLRAQKSWFMFDEVIVALGSGIACPGQAGAGWDGERRRTETIIDNRRLSAGGSERLTVDGAEKPLADGWTETMRGIAWAHLDGSEPGAGIGYYFPGGATVCGLREQRSGRWRDIDRRTGSETERRNRYMTLWFDHGTSPLGGTYAYALLPGTTARETGLYAARPRFAVIAHTEEVHAVRHAALGATGAMFWSDGAAPLELEGRPYLSCSRIAAVMVMEEEGRLSVSVSDPTQRCEGFIEVEIYRTASRVELADDGVDMLRLAPTIRLQVRPAGAAGAAFRAVLRTEGVVCGL